MSSEKRRNRYFRIPQESGDNARMRECVRARYSVRGTRSSRSLSQLPHRCTSYSTLLALSLLDTVHCVVAWKPCERVWVSERVSESVRRNQTE